MLLKNISKGYRHAGNESDQPYLSPPVEMLPGQIFTLPAPLIASGSHQPWDGYDPPCTLGDQGECSFYPSQTSNIKVQSIYDGIETFGDGWMRMASEEAHKSVDDKGGPFGALILQIDDATGEIIRYWLNHNQVTSTNDPTAHAEVMTIRSACASLGVFNLGAINQSKSKLPQPGTLSHCVVYSSAEPCPMCYSAICWSGIPTLLFAATRFDAAVQGVDFSDEAIYEELAKPYSARAMKVCQCTTGNSLDAFNLWKRSEKTPY
jgi:guanine deaminase